MRPSAAIPGADDLATRFFDEAARRGLSPIQFKSTLTLPNAFNGLEDFDLLVRPDEFSVTMQLAEELGFRQRRTTSPFHPEPITDLLGWDPVTARLHHLSLHRLLVFGERPVKRHTISWKRIDGLGSIELRPGLHVLPAPAELALLLARMLLRSSRPERLRSPWRSIAVPPDEKMITEFLHLNRQLDEEDLRTATTQLMPGAEDPILGARLQFLSEGDPGRARAYRRELVRALRPLATRSRFDAWITAVRHRRKSTIRHLERGAVVAIVGADGAGKSTVTRAVVDRLGVKLSIRRTYLGLPRDNPGVVRLARLTAAARTLRLTRPARWLAASRHVLAARLRRQSLSRASREARLGVITVTDRYPLKEFHTVEPPMDGPRLAGNGVLARIERSIYAAMPQQPDVVIALVADAAVLMSRKPDDDDPRVIAGKSAAVQRLASSRPDVTVIDATQPLEEVVARVVTAIWNRVASQPN